MKKYCSAGNFKLKTFIIIYSIIFSAFSLNAQKLNEAAHGNPGSSQTVNTGDAGTNKKSTRRITREADELYIDEMFKAALPIYIQLDAIKPENAEINYKIGICYLHTETKSKSISYFLKAQQYDRKHEFEDINYYIGIAYHYGMEFDKAIEAYEKYKLLLKPNQQFSKDMIRLVNKFVANCYTGKTLVKKPLKIKVENVGMKINSPSPEAYPVISPDEKTIYFSSKRIDLTGLKPNEEPEDIFEDIYVSNFVNNAWTPAKKVGKGINSFKHDAPLSLSADGKKLFFYKTDKNNSTDLFYIEYKDTTWTSPKPMGGKINSPSWETGASISPDGKTFYFSSDRAGGYGGMDIYVSKLQDKGTWSVPKNIGPEINTEWDEESPFILPDGRTLYFSNNGPKSIGGMDIFRTVFNSGDSLWSVPENIGYPLNSPEHENHITWTSAGHRGYFANTREDSYGDDDIYSVEFTDLDPSKPLFIVSTDTIHENVFTLPKVGDILNEKIYFDFNIASAYAEFSQPKLLEVVDFLEKYPEVKVEIGGHADNQGDPDVNFIVSNKRALTVFHYLVSRGIDPARLQAKAYSNSLLVVDGKSTIENAINRRVEFKVIAAPQAPKK